jgi:cytochrome c peroxidase
VALGRALFTDKRLSADGTISCASCHQAQSVLTDGLAVAEGVQKHKGTRNTPSLINTAYLSSQFWDGRRTSLEDQAQDPFVNPVEHGLPNHTALLRIVQGDAAYITQFRQVFGVSPDHITLDHIAKAIASFERTLIAGGSPFDRYEYGGDSSAISASARRGLALFRGRARCQTCHTLGATSALFTDDQFHSLGVGFKRIEPRLAEIATQVARAKGQDLDEAILTRSEISELGRFVVTRRPADIGRFKTPSLRNVAVTAPYMHDGSLSTLEEAVDLEVYYRSLEANRPLILTSQEKADLIAFLRSLTSPQFAQTGNSPPR